MHQPSLLRASPPAGAFGLGLVFALVPVLAGRLCGPGGGGRVRW